MSDRLREEVARALSESGHAANWLHALDGADAAIAVVIERAAQVCEKQQEVFGSTRYAANQPSSSFGERFACGRCAEEIRALAEPTP